MNAKSTDGTSLHCGGQGSCYLTVDFAVRLTLTALLFYGKNKINVKIAGKMWEHSCKHCKKVTFLGLVRAYKMKNKQALLLTKPWIFSQCFLRLIFYSPPRNKF